MAFLYPVAFQEFVDNLDYDTASEEGDHEELVHESVDEPVDQGAEIVEDQAYNAVDEDEDFYIKYCPACSYPSGKWPTGESRYAEGEMSGV